MRRSTSPAGARFARTALLATTLAAAVATQTAQQVALQVNATATSNPPTLSFSWPLDTTAVSYTVARRLVGATSWGTSTTIPGGGAITGYVDNTIVSGWRWEYWFTKNGGISARGVLTAGVECNPLENRGKLVLLVDDTQAAALATRIDRLVGDLVGDGWRVLRHDVSRTQSVASVKALIAADVAANPYPNLVTAVFLLGHVPVPYSGQIAPDGHPDHVGAWPADCYYGELNGPWTDNLTNTTSPSRPANWNVPGDGKFDQSALPSDVDLMVGRVDFADMPSFPQGETALLQQYLDKDHDYRHKVFAVDQRCVIDDNFGYFSGEAFAASGWRNGSTLVGTNNVVAADYFTTLNTTSGNGYAWSYGCGGGWYQGAGGVGSTIDFTTSTNRSVFTMLFGSYFGDWDSTDNFLRAPLCSGWTLTNAWAGRPHWSFHPMGMGEVIGAGVKLSQNDTLAGGFGGRQVHVALMGDPTLRQHIISPPSGVLVADQWPQATVSWTASNDAVAGYHVYRAPSPSGPFTRRTTTAVVGTAWLDTAPIQGDATYMVRALRLETTPSGSYWNLSQGAFATTFLPQVAAAHASYGTGCYTISDSLYQAHATPAAASAALDGTMLVLTPTANGASYTASRAPAAFVAPSPGAAVLALGDDDAIAVPLAAPFALPGGSTSALQVYGNGIVASAPLAMTLAQSATPSPSTLLGELAGAWYAWHDFDPSEPGSGTITTEEGNGVRYVTWNGVESHPSAVANPSTLQFQFELATGVVRIVCSSLGNLGSDPFLFGWSPGGASVDAGPTDLTTALPLLIPAQNALPLALAANPAPISTPTAGTLVTYTVANVPETVPGSGVRLAVVGLSLNQDVAGTSLAYLGMPGCWLGIGTLDVPVLCVGTGPSLTAALDLAAGIPPGARFFATAIAFVQSFSLPNSLNAYGAVTSNGIASIIGRF